MNTDNSAVKLLIEKHPEVEKKLKIISDGIKLRDDFTLREAVVACPIGVAPITNRDNYIEKHEENSLCTIMTITYTSVNNELSFMLFIRNRSIGVGIYCKIPYHSMVPGVRFSLEEFFSEIYKLIQA